MADLADFLVQHGVDHRIGGTHRHVRTGWIGIDCPRCGPGSGKFHAGIREDLRGAACWRCGGMRPFDLIGQACELQWWEVRKALEPLPVRSRSRETASNQLRGVKYPARLQTLRRPHKLFLARRNLDPGAAEQLWGARATGPIGRLSWRIWIPIYHGGRVVSWTTRAVGRRVDRRYISASPDEEAVDHKTLLYGEELVGHAIVIVEGPLDAWRIGPGAVATLGLNTTPAQIERMGRHPIRAICFDRERAATRRAKRLANVLQQYAGDTHVVELETGSDPGDADAEEIEQIRREFLD